METVAVVCFESKYWSHAQHSLRAEYSPVSTGVVDLLGQWNTKELYVDIEYEVDELRRDMKIPELENQGGIKCTSIHGKLLVEPGTQQGKPFTVSVCLE